MNNSSDNIAAAAALGRIAEIRQFELEEDYSHLAKMEAVIRINNEAKEITGIDLLGSNKKLSFSQLEKYESYLEKVIDRNLTHKFSDSFLADEIGLLNMAEDFPVHTFRLLPIKLEGFMPSIKQVFKTIGISVPSIMPILKNPYRVQKIEHEELVDLFILSRFELKSKPIIALFHATIGEMNISTSISSFSKQQENSKKVSEEGDVSLIACFLFDGTRTQDTSPISLFLSAIVKYGRDITIGHTTKKFFLKGASSSLLIQNGDELKIQDDILSSKGVASFAMRETPTGYEYTTLYTIAQDRLVRDISRHQFI